WIAPIAKHDGCATDQNFTGLSHRELQVVPVLVSAAKLDPKMGHADGSKPPAPARGTAVGNQRARQPSGLHWVLAPTADMDTARTHHRDSFFNIGNVHWSTPIDDGANAVASRSFSFCPVNQTAHHRRRREH